MNLIKYRKLYGLKSDEPSWADIEADSALSTKLDACTTSRLFLCGSLADMSRAYVEEPLSRGWAFARQYAHRHRSPVYGSESGRTISVKLISTSWLPDCESMSLAVPAWRALKDEWQRATHLPLLSTPSKTGQAFMWETFPRNESYPALPDDIAKLVRRISPQHRQEIFKPDFDLQQSIQYDGRWMYAAQCLVDRFPVGSPQPASKFEPFQPGWYHVSVTIPHDWSHIGLLPFPDDDNTWIYPRRPGQSFEVWASEPELTLAIQSGWKIETIEGWQFAKGRPLRNWASKLIEMREVLKAHNYYAGAAVREILNHAIGSLHADGYEREVFVSNADWKQWRRANEDLLDRKQYTEVVPGGRMVPVIVPNQSPLSIYMPHWSSTIWALERARVASAALRCDFDSLVKINGDAIYADRELPIEDNGRIGQLRRKAVK